MNKYALLHILARLFKAFLGCLSMRFRIDLLHNINDGAFRHD
ncbi:hypothetical protein HMPREF3220_01471 [Citrobacter koseri]|nr:hypothetical protein HMPREF3207_04531 [Citrobacter koseri]KXA01693.1 hypothetical protein HMPREF3220_01471 [Citrobacter koseri]